jgi:hypothetical protein
MPGFQISRPDGNSAMGYGPDTNHEYIYTYTWTVPWVIGVGSGSIGSPTRIARTVTTPTISIGIETKQGASLEYKFAKNVSYDDVKMTFYEDYGFIQTMNKWRESVWSPETGLTQSNDYKKETIIDIFGPHDSINELYSWVLYGSWPSTIRHGELTYTNSDVNIVEVTVTYDYALVKRSKWRPRADI